MELKLEKLFQEISEITKIEDIGYHEVVDGKLKPFYKTKTGKLTLEEWKNGHAENPVYIKNNPILLDVIETKKMVVIQNTKNDKRSTGDVFSFGVNSLIMLPIVKNDEVVAVIAIVSIDETCEVSEELGNKCKELLNKYEL